MNLRPAAREEAMAASDAPAEVKIRCRRCGSTQRHVEKRRPTATRGSMGPDDVALTCLKCGNTQKPGPIDGDTVLETIGRDLDYGIDLKKEIARLKVKAERSGSREDRAAYVRLKLYRGLLLALGVIAVGVVIWLVFFGGWWVLLKEVFNLG